MAGEREKVEVMWETEQTVLSCLASLNCWSGVFHVSALTLRVWKSASCPPQICHAKVTELCLPTFWYICCWFFIICAYDIIDDLPKLLKTCIKNTKTKGFRISVHHHNYKWNLLDGLNASAVFKKNKNWKADLLKVSSQGRLKIFSEINWI